MMEFAHEQHVHGPSCTGREFYREVDGSVPLKCISLLLLSHREQRFYCQIAEDLL